MIVVLILLRLLLPALCIVESRCVILRREYWRRSPYPDADGLKVGNRRDAVFVEDGDGAKGLKVLGRVTAEVEVPMDN